MGKPIANKYTVVGWAQVWALFSTRETYQEVFLWSIMQGEV